MHLSIVATLFKSEEYIDEFCDRISNAANQITDEFEIILVNDGSPDKSLEVALLSMGKLPKIRVIDLSRNFGHHAAMLEGLAHANGDKIFLIDVDLEEPPELLNVFWRKMENDPSVDLIGGVQQKRKGHILERSLGRMTWGLFQRMSPVELPSNLITARLMTKDYVRAILSYPERELFIASICADAGFNQHFVKVNKASTSKTSYSLIRKLNLFFSGVTSTSPAPLLATVAVAIALMILTVGVGFYALMAGIAGYSSSGWASIIFLIAFATTVIALLQGVTAIYIAHIFKEVKNRPRAIVKRVFESE